MKTETLLKLLALSAVGYMLYKALSAASNVASNAAAAVSTGYNSAVSNIGAELNTLFGPGVQGTNMYFTAMFPDGTSHAVPSNIVNPITGAFTWTGYPAGSQPAVNLTLVQDASGAWYAT